jgi:hypothetical protein
MGWWKATYEINPQNTRSYKERRGAVEVYVTLEEQVLEQAQRQAALKTFGSVAYSSDIIITAYLQIERPESH